MKQGVGVLGAGFRRKWGRMEQDMGVHRGRMEQVMEDVGRGMRDRETGRRRVFGSV